ncbi:MAG: dihydropteroate synthase [Flavobacteriaceae bacterium]|nr:dihydropteroate synthase [Flavobacteriaceae bacterium]
MTINCAGTLIDLNTPRVMGILNQTPDSFYDGGRYSNPKAVLDQVEQMLFNGASFIDIGGYSSRPGATDVSEQEELDRVIPTIKAVVKAFPDAVISIDTFRSGVAKVAIEEGAAMINDISGGDRDPEIYQVAAGHQVPYILMHMRGTPLTMTTLTDYDNVVMEVAQDLAKKLKQIRPYGVNDLIVDPGFGFAKNLEQNYSLLGKLDHLKLLNAPILVGLSRKSMIYKLLQTDPENALNGTTAANTIALLKGASILRVHDVAPAMEVVKLVGALKN